MIQTEFVLHMINKCIICHVPEGCMHGAIAAVAAAATHEHHHHHHIKEAPKVGRSMLQRASTAKQRWGEGAANLRSDF
jgi:hypothetical protein